MYIHTINGAEMYSNNGDYPGNIYNIQYTMYRTSFHHNNSYSTNSVLLLENMICLGGDVDLSRT